MKRIPYLLLASTIFAGCIDQTDDLPDNGASHAGKQSSGEANTTTFVSLTPPHPQGPQLTRELVEVLSARPEAEIDYEKMERIVDAGLDDLRINLATTIDNQEKIDYGQVRSLFFEVLEQKMSEPPRYQFICDVNERWIYRCNLFTGEIELFSMTSKELLLLSRTK